MRLYSPAHIGLLIQASAALKCKCVPGDSCWPAESEWDTLNSTISGRLIKTVLPASVCYKSDTNYDETQCEIVQANWALNVFHSNNPASIHSPQWANNSCNAIYSNGTSLTGDTLAGSRGCTIGRYPPYVVNATEASHVQAAVRFVHKHNIRLNVKNTGHNGAGRSTAFGSLSVWTHHLRGFKLDKKWVPTCRDSKPCKHSKPQMAATIGAGMQDIDLFDAAATEGAAVVGGTNQNVGFMGWATAGGHGWLTSEFGQGADNILEASIVTPSGDLVTANEHQHSDLFWAIRGGGGGTFGVIVEATIQAYPMPQATVWTIDVSTKNTSCTACWYRFVAELHAYLPELKKGGLQGNYVLGGPPSYENLTFYGLFFLYNKPNGTTERLIQPFISHLEAANETTEFISNIIWAPSWISVYKKFPDLGSSAATGGGATTSRLLSAKAVTKDVDALAQTLEIIGPSAEGPQNGFSNPSISGSMAISSVKVNSALNPVWRDTVVHMAVSSGWKDNMPYQQAERAVDDMTNVKGAALRRLEPNGGAYMNEADPYEPDWQKSFFGKNYKRLRSIKEKYDPDPLQWCMRCVGSESWFEQPDGKLCKAV
ncbi:FAD-linked oxidoreductase ZEB1 [Fusarium oxysporum f. sp. raphani]|uniref:FAD-linked oxidoreductase ZEB1 n=1 Tax=Fusarium oxysporum f. sp. raphani TaxID=96318 RepID=A0A8J5PD35_FUSOX|nr:FAD-linked oxidoreductase ZEB1 [Fusarium oxysporum f. sp. raphani]